MPPDLKAAYVRVTPTDLIYRKRSHTSIGGRTSSLNRSCYSKTPGILDRDLIASKAAGMRLFSLSGQDQQHPGLPAVFKIPIVIKILVLNVAEKLAPAAFPYRAFSPSGFPPGSRTLFAFTGGLGVTPEITASSFRATRPGIFQRVRFHFHVVRVGSRNGSGTERSTAGAGLPRSRFVDGYIAPF